MATTKNSRKSGSSAKSQKSKTRDGNGKSQPDVYYEYETDTRHVPPQYGPPKTYDPNLEGLDPEEGDIISIDLTDPEDLMRKLELLDLTDEEADELLKKAIEVNKQLREELDDMGQPIARSFAASAPGGLRSLQSKERKKSSGTKLPPIARTGTIVFPASRLVSASSSLASNNPGVSSKRVSPLSSGSRQSSAGSKYSSSSSKSSSQGSKSSSKGTKSSKYDPPTGASSLQHAKLRPKTTY